MLVLLFNYTFKNSFALIASILILSSCTEGSEKNLTVIKELNEGLATSNKMLNISTTDYLVSLEAKLAEPATSERAKYWYPKAQLIQTLSKSTYDYLESIRNDLLKKIQTKPKIGDDYFEQRSGDIYDSLIAFKKKVLAVDKLIGNVFRKSIIVFSQTFDTSDGQRESFNKQYFKSSNVYVAAAMLTQLQNNVQVIANKAVVFCHEQIGSTGRICTFTSAIAGINSSVVQPEGRIEIFSGVGSFDSRFKAQVYVYGKPVPLNESAIAVCKFKAQKKPGKYYVPVKINYTDQDGKSVTVEKEIEYTVANIQKQ